MAKRVAGSHRTASARSASERLSGKVAWITGGALGIGLAIAKALAAEACSVAITGRNQGSLKAAKAEIARINKTAQLFIAACDVRDSRAVQSVAEEIRRQFGRLDILVNNAGISHGLNNVDQLPPETWLEVIQTNLTGMFACTRAALPLMQPGATVINNLSIAARRVFTGQAAYCASKQGGLALTQSLREEVRGQGIRVVALLPGATDTELWQQFWPEAPRNRMLRPETVAQAVLDAILLPSDSNVEEITVMPTAGAL